MNLFCDLMNFRTNAERLRKIDDVSGRIGRGVYKRIDENRELLELLKHDAPDLLLNRGNVEGWLRSHDDFFTELEKIVHIPNPWSRKQLPGFEYPRPWPGSRSKP